MRIWTSTKRWYSIPNGLVRACIVSSTGQQCTDADAEEIEGANKEEVKKKGIAKKLRRIVEDLGDDKSTLGKTIKGMKHGVEIAQDIGKQYNKIAQWLGMPQVPGLFLGE